jgi:GWxTD domain-containing protein
MLKKNISPIFLIILLGILSSRLSYADDEKSFFYMDALNFYSPDSTKSRLDVYLEFPLDKLEFSRSKEENNVYSSKVDIKIEIKDNKGISVIDKLYKEEIVTPKTESEYLSANSKIFTKNYFLQPGLYKLKITSTENTTKKSSTFEKDITMRDFLASPISISDVMILSKYEVSRNRKNITPDISRNVSGLDTFTVFFFIYKNNNEDTRININFNVNDSKKNLIYSSSDYLDLTKGLDSLNQVFLRIPIANYSFDNYSVEITAISNQYTSSVTSSFVYVNYDFPANLNNIDLLISQLQYIANDKEMDNIKSGKDDAEKRKRFLEFWKSKDPVPNSKKNRVMIEYYKRLNYANKHFSTSYTEGWRSDMGMVFIIFGMPSSVDKHPFEMDSKPYEIWDYYDTNREFVFVDDTGFGEYRLITPIYNDTKFKP